jgi:hypothetical protein
MTAKKPRRVLQVHTGRARESVKLAQDFDCPEIEERDDIPPGGFNVVEEPLGEVTQIDVRYLYEHADTIKKRIVLLEYILGLAPLELLTKVFEGVI